MPPRFRYSLVSLIGVVLVISAVVGCFVFSRKVAELEKENDSLKKLVPAEHRYFYLLPNGLSVERNSTCSIIGMNLVGSYEVTGLVEADVDPLSRLVIAREGDQWVISYEYPRGKRGVMKEVHRFSKQYMPDGSWILCDDISEEKLTDTATTLATFRDLSGKLTRSILIRRKAIQVAPTQSPPPEAPPPDRPSSSK